MELPRSYTPQILGVLVQAGLAEARAGRDGGYRLLRDPSQVSLLELVEAGEGPLRPARCSLRGGPCRWDDMCAIHPAWDAATQALQDSLGATSLAAVAEVDAELDSGTYSSPKPRTAGKPDGGLGRPRSACAESRTLTLRSSSWAGRSGQDQQGVPRSGGWPSLTPSYPLRPFGIGGLLPTSGLTGSAPLS